MQQTTESKKQIQALLHVLDERLSPDFEAEKKEFDEALFIFKKNQNVFEFKDEARKTITVDERQMMVRNVFNNLIDLMPDATTVNVLYDSAIFAVDEALEKNDYIII